MKKKIVKFLKWLLGKLDKLELKKCTIDLDFSCEMSKFILDDKKWHHVSYNIDYWIKVNGKDNVDKIQRANSFKNGLLIDELRILKEDK